MKHLLLLCIILLLAGASELHAQNQLVQAPNAVKLRRVWTQFGKNLTADEYGKRIWGGVDISGDSIADIGVYRGSTNEWLFYRGGAPAPDTVPFQVVPEVGFSRPGIGNFFADGYQYALFTRGRSEVVNGATIYYVIPTLYRISNDSIDLTIRDTMETRAFLEFQVHHVDQDEWSDIAIVRKFHGSAYKGEILFYMGGPNFRLDTPSVIVVDTGLYGPAEYNWRVHFADFDGDGRLDMVMGGDYPGVGAMLRFYWGDENSPYSWAERQPDRDIIVTSEDIGLVYTVRSSHYLDDYDGDGAADLSGSRAGRPSSPYGPGVYVYLSSRGNARTRSFRYEDADIYYPDQARGFVIGPLNQHIDSIRYDMLSLGTLYVSGSSTGPDFDYDAWHAQDGIDFSDALGRGMPVGDVTGDGWHDAAEGNETYGPAVSTGVAMILAGGPYIPFDDPTVSVREEPVAGIRAGLFLWPNPVIDELHIAWRGDLGQMPRRFEIYDMAGRLVVGAEVDPSLGSVTWQCADVPTGSYLLVGFDSENNRITEARILKR